MKHNFQRAVKVGGHRSSEPMGSNVYRGLLPGNKGFGAGRKIDFQPVGLDGLDGDSLFEFGPADREYSAPASCRTVRPGDCLKGVESVFSAAQGLAFEELPFGSIKLHRCRMGCRQRMEFIFNYQRQVQRVTRAPDTPFAIDITLQAPRDLLSSYIKTAERFFVGASANLKMRDGIALFSLNDERLSADREIRKTVLAGVSFSHFLELIIVCGDFYAFHRSGRYDVGHGYPQAGFVGTFDDDANIGCRQVQLRELAVILIIAGLFGVITV